MSLIDEVIARVREKNSDQPEFLQAVEEVFSSLQPTAERYPELVTAKIYDRIVEPDRVVMFRVTWQDDTGEVQVNRGYRVQFNNALGPYKGGLRFHRSVDLGVVKFLGFEQIFKNALTSLPLGGGKGGSDFDPHGKSDAEVMRFCQAFMRELYRHIGPDTDVPAGDVGVGAREIGYLYGYYKKIVNQHDGALTGKPLEHGGSLIRTEATGYGAVYLAAEMLSTRGETMAGKKAAISGSGNVAQYTAEKLIQLGAGVITLSDSDGTVVDEAGLDMDKLAFVKDLKNNKRGRIKAYTSEYKQATYYEGESAWDVVTAQGLHAELAFPSATENEIHARHAQALADNGCICVVEGANMPSSLEAIEIYQQEGILFGPAKAANAGGVATSGLEMSQNSQRMVWPRKDVDAKLQGIMKHIHAACLEAAEAYGRPGDYLFGANIAGFLRVANAMLAYGVV